MILRRTVFIILLSIFLMVGGFMLYQNAFPRPAPPSFETFTEFEEVHDKSIYGYHPDSVYVDSFTMEWNQTLGDILYPYGVSHQQIAILAERAKDVFSVRSLRVGKRAGLIRDNHNGEVIALVYEPSAYRYVKYNLRDSIYAEMINRDYETCIEEARGVITSSLWAAMDQEGFKHALIVEMEHALAWSVDFHHILRGDIFKLIFEREYIDGEPVGIGKLAGAYYKNNENEYYSIYFENPKYSGYYDEEGRPMKKAFLKAPVQYSQVRISSRYNLRRFHPVLKRTRAHYGTDYAAPCGTPIIAVADGVVLKAGYTSGNGNYVKVRHDDVYQTQYLHMTRFASHVKPGVHVKQGQVIGYVGKTGLATGCHVCFRFWKHGRQVDHLREKLPPPDPMPDEFFPVFYETRDSIKARLDAIPDPVML